ncbi:hypothetical protein M8994_14705 [Brucella sp. 21LCYQ03]|nr:hypothetical protein [Brucella sp. 21LCYQ03]
MHDDTHYPCEPVAALFAPVFARRYASQDYAVVRHVNRFKVIHRRLLLCNQRGFRAIVVL